jgi:aryl-alcohol dehydrogenase-like predicted oxidoreductase
LPDDASGTSRLGLGTAPFIAGYSWGQDAACADPDRLIAACLDAGVRYIDTSGHYGDVEIVLGRQRALLAKHRARLCVKVAVREWPDGLYDAFGRLGVERADTVMVHSATGEFLREPELAETMSKVKAMGRAARTGASTYGVDDALCVLEQPWGTAVQVEYSVLNPSVVRAIGPRSRADQEIVVRTVLCRGLLTGRWREVPIAASAPIAPTLERLQALAASWGFDDLAELAIRFALDSPHVGIVLVGIASGAELAIAIAAAQRPPLTPAQMDALTEFDHSTSDWTHPERWEAAA